MLIVIQEPARKTSPKPPWNYGAGGSMGRGVFQVVIFHFFGYVCISNTYPGDLVGQLVSWLLMLSDSHSVSLSLDR